MNKYKRPALLAMSFCVPISWHAQAVTPVLDGYAYQLNGDIIIDTINHIITIDSDMQNCQQPNGSDPLDTQLFALNNSSEFIGLSDFLYKTEADTIFFTSETVNITCDNGVYVDTLFFGGFD